MSKPIFSTESFAAWCFEQGDRTFYYCNGQECALQQYLSSKGINVSGVGGDYWRIGTKKYPIPASWVDKLHDEDIKHEGKWSFQKLGELLVRD